MKKKLIVYSTFFMCILNSWNSFSEINNNNDNKNKKIDFAKKVRLENEIDIQLESLFSAIRNHNNKYVKFHLKLKEEITSTQFKEYETNEKGIYGPFNEKSIQPSFNNTKIDVNTMDKYGYTPIIVAIESKNNEILKLLLENGANIYEKHPVFGRLTLHTACYYENEEAVKILLDYNKDLVNYQSGNDGWTPLQDATLKSNTSIVKLLLDYGANPLIRDYNNGTPMNMATEFGKGEIVKLLRDNIKKNRNK